MVGTNSDFKTDLINISNQCYCSRSCPELLDKDSLSVGHHQGLLQIDFRNPEAGNLVMEKTISRSAHTIKVRIFIAPLQHIMIFQPRIWSGILIFHRWIDRELSIKADVWLQKLIINLIFYPSILLRSRTGSSNPWIRYLHRIDEHPRSVRRRRKLQDQVA